MKLVKHLFGGKFEKYLEVGNHFLYGGDYIIVAMKEAKYWENSLNFNRFQKDSLNRFNGLFDGRTYGSGECNDLYVLVQDDEDDIMEISKDGEVIGYRLKGKLSDKKEGCTEKSIGNLHQNPELYENCRKGNKIIENPELWERINV